jgi:hypothetical protein
VKNHRSLRYVTMRVGGTARSARREPWAGSIRAWATRGILVPAVVLGALGAGIAASPAYASGVHASTGSAAGSHPARARVAAKACKSSTKTAKSGSKAAKSGSKATKALVATPARPWIYAPTVVTNRPWIYAATVLTNQASIYVPEAIGTRPWIYATSNKVACTSGAAPAASKPDAAAAHGTRATTVGRPVPTVAG